MANIQTNQNRRQVKRIDTLPDEVLLEIFQSYMEMHPLRNSKTHTEAWQTLVHVCRQWRSLVLASPRRLNLRVYCTPKTPAKDKLDVWPPLPLIIEGHMARTSVTENIVAALGQSNRVRRVELHLVTQRQFEEVSAAMQVPFPELTQMRLFLSNNETPPVNPDSFFGESAPPRLQYFGLIGIPLSGLPNLLSCATHLVCLTLFAIPQSGYISPGAMVALLSVLSSLRKFYLGFQYPKPTPGWDDQIPRTRSILPALDKFRFKGDPQYLEELVASIDTPQLNRMHITSFPLFDNVSLPQFAQYIHRTPNFRVCDKAHLQFYDLAIGVMLRCPKTGIHFFDLLIKIASRRPDWQLSSIKRVCDDLLLSLSMVEDLYIEHRYLELIWDDPFEVEVDWSQLLLPFAAVKNLYLSKEFAPGFAAALGLQGLDATERLPGLQAIFVDAIEPSLGTFKDNVGEFIAARQLSGRPITISFWNKDSD